MAIIRKIPWTRQPPQGVGIDKTHPLTRGLYYAINHVDPIPRDLMGHFDQTDVIKVGSPIQKAHADGLGVYIANRGTRTGWNLNDNSLDLSTPTTVFHYAALVGDPGDTDEFSLSNAELSGSNRATVLGSTTVPDDDNAHAIGFCWDSASAILYQDGLQIGIDSSVNAGWGSYLLRYDNSSNRWEAFVDSSGGSTFNVGMGIGTKTADQWHGYIYLSLWWDRKLSASEHMQLSQNMWQIFQPRTQIIPIEVAAGGADLDLIATLVDVSVADLLAAINSSRNLTGTLVDTSAAGLLATMNMTRDLTGTLVDVATADLDATLNLTRNLTGTLIDVAVADIDATLGFGSDLDLTATLTDIAVADLDATANLSHLLTASLVDIAVADIDATVGLDRDLTGTLVDVAVSGVAGALNLSRNLTVTLVDVAVADEDATVVLVANLAATAAAVVVADHNATVTLAGDEGTLSIINARRGLFLFMKRR